MNIINVIKEALNKLNIQGFIVGGYLRDGLLKEKSNDIDIVVSDKIEELINLLEQSGLQFFLLNEAEKIYRTEFNDMLIDITIIRGENIYIDLKNRDFTINSTALSLQNNEIVDPENGMSDIKKRILRTADPERIKEDPIRILRGIRFIIKYGFSADMETSDSFRKFSFKLKSCKKERKFLELMKIVEDDRDGICFSVMDELGVLEDIIPYARENKTIGKCKYHIEDALTHMITTYKVFRSFLKGELELGIDTEGLYTKNISCFSIKHYQALAAFLHDVGKYVCYNKIGNKVTFYDHQVKGQLIAEGFLEEYGFPKKGIKIIDDLILGHMEPLFLFKNNDDRKQYLKFFRRFGELTPYIIVLSFCDVYATRLYHDPDEEIIEYRIFIENLYSEFLRFNDIIKNPVISAENLIAEKGLEGKEIREAIDLINDKTYLGFVKNKYESLNIIKSGVKNEKR